MDFEQIKPALISYLHRLEKQLTINQALVFGSIAQNQADETSDVDLLILSDDLSKFDEDDRARILYRASVGLPFDLHVYGLTPQEFDTASPLSVPGALKHQKTLKLQ